MLGQETGLYLKEVLVGWNIVEYEEDEGLFEVVDSLGKSVVRENYANICRFDDCDLGFRGLRAA